MNSSRRDDEHHVELSVCVRGRVGADWVNKHVCSPYYSVLVRQDAAEQRRAFETIVEGLEKFASWCEEGEGAFYAGKSTPGLVDYALFPGRIDSPSLNTTEATRLKSHEPPR